MENVNKKPLDRPFTLRGALRDLIAASGETGANIDQMAASTGATKAQCKTGTAKLVNAGAAFAAKSAGNYVWLYFAKSEWRDAHQRKQPPIVPRKKPSAEKAKQNITFSPPKQPSALKPQGGDAIITANTKITRDTTWHPTARWQMLPEQRDERWPSFAASRPGVNPDTGDGWESRA